MNRWKTVGVFGAAIVVIISVVLAERFVDQNNTSNQNRVATQAFECERDVVSMKGKAADFKKCLEAKGWATTDASTAADRYFLNHVSGELRP